MENQQIIRTEDNLISSCDPGIELFLRNKRPANLTEFSPERTLLFVHGATYPASTSFDMKLGGFSWMDYIARQGYDVYALDLRGYGHSSRPSEMSEPAADHPPLVTGDIGIQDITTAVDYILAKRNIDRINLLGWSWGTALMGKYASLNPARVARLVLYAPLWLFKPTLNGNDSSGLPAYRSVTQDETRERWLKGVPIEVQDTLIPPGWFESWADMTWATDEVGFKKIPPILRAPNGVLQDAMEYFLVGKPYYDPSKITAPTLVIGAEWDNETPPYMAQDLFKLLVNSPGKHHEELTKGTHSIIMEMNRLALFSAVQRFLT